jgi:hypothetical protein
MKKIHVDFAQMGGTTMPRIKPLIRPDPRAIELKGEIGKLQEQTGKSYRYLCRKAGIEYATFMLHKSDVRSMRYGEFWAFMDACRKEIGV